MTSSDEASTPLQATHHLLYDVPLTSLPEDRLGYADFAKQIAQSIVRMDAEHGFVFALNGPWGSGKTTVLNFVLSELEGQQTTDRPVVVVKFNPWWFSGRDQLLHQFFLQLRATLGQPDNSAELRGISSKLETFERYIGYGTWIPKVGKVAGWGQRMLKAVRGAAERQANLLKTDVQGQRDDIDAALRGQSARLVIVMDDLDRLPPAEIHELFQLTKAVANFPKTVYILAFDQRIVANALNTIQGAVGEEYIEKIVQAPFSLPLPDRAGLESVLFQNLNEILADSPEDLWEADRWAYVYSQGIAPFIRTPRDVIRLSNLLKVIFPLVVGEVNPIDFIGIQIIQMYTPNVHSDVSHNKTKFVGRDFDDGDNERSSYYQDVINRSPVHRQSHVIRLMSHLFPKVSKEYSHQTFGDPTSWRRLRRICNPETFEIYFRLTVSPGVIGYASLREILARSGTESELEGTLITFMNDPSRGGGRGLSSLLRMIDDSVEDMISVDIAIVMLRTFYSVGDKLIENDEVYGPFELPNIARIWLLSEKLLRKISNESDRYELLRSAFESGKAITLMTHHALRLAAQHGRFGDDSTIPESDRLLSVEHQSQIEQLVARRIATAAQDRTLQRAPHLSTILVFLEETGRGDEARQIVRDLTADDEGFADLLSGFLSQRFSWGGDHPGGRKETTLNVALLLTFLGGTRDEALARCERILREEPAWLTDRQRIGLETFAREARSSGR
jgi:predicted KAP-like P-loop ATPase